MATAASRIRELEQRKRFARWTDQGVWAQMHQHCCDDADLEYLIIDSTVVRAHPCAGSSPKKGGQAAQALGRSRGGFSTKIHVVDWATPCDSTGGQQHDITQAEELTPVMLASTYWRPYDAQEFRHTSWMGIRSFRPTLEPQGTRRLDRHLSGASSGGMLQALSPDLLPV